MTITDLRRATLGLAEFESLYRATIPRVHALVRRLVGRAEADDAALSVLRTRGLEAVSEIRPSAFGRIATVRTPSNNEIRLVDRSQLEGLV